MAKAKKDERPTLDISDVEEVAALLTVEQRIQKHINTNPEFYKTLCLLTQERNDVLKQAEARVRGEGVNCGPFVINSEAQKVDAEKLFEELGDAQFKALGGYTETVTDYKVDRVRLLAHVAAGDLPKEVVDLCVKTELRYKKPDLYLLP